MNKKDELVNTKVIVEEILSVSNKARNSDKVLIWYYFKSIGVDIDIKVLEAMPSFESITRARRKLQEEGLFLSDNQIADKKEQYQDEVTEWSLGV